MSSPWTPDVWVWLSNLPSVSEWKTNSMSLCICTCSSSSHPSLNLSIITKSSQSQNPHISLSLIADFHLPISLWTSSSFHLRSKSHMDEEAIFLFFHSIINGVLKYGPRKDYLLSYPSARYGDDIRDMFNLAFLTLAFLVCIYEAPGDLRVSCLESLKLQLSSSKSREASKLLARAMGANLEEQWMGSINLAITNRIIELQASDNGFRVPSSLFSYAISAVGLWKVQLYCPTIAMGIEKYSSGGAPDERLQFSLRYQQLQGVIQFTYKLTFRESWIALAVSVDNVRCDVNSLLADALMAERGLGSEEKHFPSRVSLQLTPTRQSHIIAVSVGKSSDNPTHEHGHEKAVEGAFDPPKPYVGVRVSASETVTTSVRPWKFEQSVSGLTANLSWFLHGGTDGKEVFSSKPSKLQLLQPKTWFRDRYSGACRPFTKEGGVVFAGDEYGERVWWKISGGEVGKVMEWEIRGWIWLTYWPNRHRSLYTETRRLEFRELVQVPLVKH